MYDINEFGPNIRHMLLYLFVHLVQLREHKFPAIWAHVPFFIHKQVLAQARQDKISDKLVTILYASQVLYSDLLNLAGCYGACVNDFFSLHAIEWLDDVEDVY